MEDKAWDDLHNYQQEWDALLKKESEIKQQWRSTQDNEIKKQLEDEFEKLPFSDVQRKMAEAMSKCYYKPS